MVSPPAIVPCRYLYRYLYRHQQETITRFLTWLLDPARPELALFAAWAMHHRRGPKARNIVLQTVELTTQLPDEPLREAQARAILAVLSEGMSTWLREMTMDPSKIPESPSVRRFMRLLDKRGRAEGRTEGKQEALLAFLMARGLAPTDAERAHVAACTSLVELDRWIQRAASASSISDVFAPAPVRTARRSPTKARARSPEREGRTVPRSKKPARQL